MGSEMCIRDRPTLTHIYPHLPTLTHTYPHLPALTHTYPHLPTFTRPTLTHTYPPLPTLTHIYPPLPTLTHIYRALPTTGNRFGPKSCHDGKAHEGPLRQVRVCRKFRQTRHQQYSLTGNALHRSILICFCIRELRIRAVCCHTTRMMRSSWPVLKAACACAHGPVASPTVAVAVPVASLVQCSAQ